MSLQKNVKIAEIHETENIGQNGFKKRMLIGKTIEPNEQELPFEFQYDNTDQLDNFVCNEEVTITFVIRCKGYAKNPNDAKKYYPTLVAYKIERIAK